MNGYIQNSIFLKYLKKINQVYLALIGWAGFIYSNSFTGRLIKKNIQLLKISFELSILGRLTNIGQVLPTDFFKTSNIINAISAHIIYLRHKLIIASATSDFSASIRGLKYNFFVKPLKVGGKVILIAVIVNLFLSVIIHNQITIWRWLASGLLLYIGLIGLFCNAGWEDIKKTSFILNNI